ncbi:4915_t:CDS:2 [Gigaspora rosea]|nr:4915_t:CDS:2 [Gigaspora rosea]
MNALLNKLPRVNLCWQVYSLTYGFFVPLQIGAFIVTAWMLVWFAYAGIVVMTISYSSSIGFTIFWKGLGICYLLLALGAFYGAHAIYYQIPHRIAVSSALADAKAKCEQASKTTKINCDAYTSGVGYPIVSWLIPFAIGSLWQVSIGILYESHDYCPLVTVRRLGIFYVHTSLYICIAVILELTERSEKPGQYNGP